MKTRTRSRLLAALLVLVMVITLLPTAAFAAEGATATKITSADALTTGQYVMVTSTGYAPGVLDGTWVTAVAVDASTDTVTVDPATVWTLTVDGSTVKLTDSNGVTIAPNSGNTNGIQSGDYSWAVTCTDGMFRFAGQGADTTVLASNKGSGNKFRAYKAGTVSGNPNSYPADFTLYKVGEVAPAEVNHLVTDLAELEEGDRVVIYNPGHALALSSEMNGSWYLHGKEVEITDGHITTPAEEMIWTVGIDDDGAYTFTQEDGKTVSAWLSGTYVELSNDAQYDNGWKLDICNAENHTFYLYSSTLTTSYGNSYIEVYAKSGVDTFCGFSTGTSKLTEKDYGMQLYLIAEEAEDEEPTIFADGDHVVIYNPANMKALSQNYTGYYNMGVDVTLTGGVLSGFGETEVWTVGVNEDGSYTFSTADGKKLAMAATNTSMPLDEANPNWKITEANTEGCYYIQNTVRGNYVEWYADKGNWSSYYNIGSNEALFAQAFYKVEGDIPTPPVGDLPAVGDQVVIYNVSAAGVLAAQDDNTESPSITNAAAEIADGKAVPENGGVVFTVEKNGNYYRFQNETYGYLCSNGTGNNAFYSAEATEDADWTLAAYNGGYTMESRTAKFNDKYSQFMEYYAGAYKTYSMYNVTDKDIYTFKFYPVAESVNVIDGLVIAPEIIVSDSLPAAYVGQNYEFPIVVSTIFAIKNPWLEYSVKDQDGNYLTEKMAGEVDVEVLTPDFAGGKTDVNITVFNTAVAKAAAKGDSMIVTLSYQDVKGNVCVKEITVPVIDAPVISNVTPENNSETGDEKKPVISAEISNAGENPTVTMTVNDETVEAVYADGKVSYTPAEAMADGRVNVTVTVTRADGKESSKSWHFTVGEAAYQLYFGQLHSHTTYSDGSGTLDAALDYIAGLPESANVDFVAFTDHSNYFDKSGDANPEGALYDMSLATSYSQGLWKEFKDKVATFNASQSDVVALGGFEMTWSGGPGHINTFNTPGIVSRNNTTLNNKTSDAGMKAYYALLSQPEGVDSLSQFNHPGTTFGNFSDFSYWDAVIDSRIFMVEVGNGEGQIGAGGYYPSYEQYIMALDKGWHVAPTNNQDNHKGKWGNANDARDVILTDDFSEQGLYEAIRNMRMYATEDKNLELYYTVNGQQLGSSIEEVPEKLDVSVQVSDPDKSDSISKVEVVVNSGKVAYTWDDPAVLASGNLSCTLAPDYSYYFIRVTEGDGDIAVTAPVWVGETLKLGISSVECGTATPVTGEELELTTTLFNSESTDATVKSVTYTTNGAEVIGTDTTGYTISASGMQTVSFQYTPTAAKVMTITVTVVLEQDGKEYTYSMDVTLDVLNADSLVYIGVDASHHNEYVAGNYKDSMGNFGNLAAGYSVRTVQLNTSEDLIAACSNEKYKAIILTAPSRRDGTALRDPYDTYTDDEIAALVAFNGAGGSLVLAGWSDYYESYSAFPAEDHMAAQQNKLLAALGSSLRISDDGVNDDSLNGGQTQRLYLSTYNFDSFLLDGVEYDPENPNNNMYSQLFSHYGGASIYAVDASGNPAATVPATVTPVVYGHATTYSKDSDSDGLGGSSVPKYAYAEGDNRLMVMATEQLPNKGLIVVSGAAFMSNFEVQATISDSNAEKNYSNYNICENLVQYLNPVTVTDIATVQRQTETGYKYTIEGVVTSNASGYDKDTAFFDCIYVQDATGGICCFPVAGEFKIGDKVRITGTTDFYQGEAELQVTSIAKIGESEPVAPTEVTAAQINDRSVLGSLVTVKGTVESFELANGLVQTIMVKDAEGNVARVFIDGYITTAKDVENLEVGCAIAATGLASYDDTFDGPAPRIRVRDRADIICTAAQEHVHVWGEWTVTKAATCTETGVETRTCSGCGETETREIAMIAHTVVVDPAVAPTYDDTGLTEGSHCSVCGEVIKAQEIVPALGHKCAAFTDIDMWAKDSICFVIENDYMNGMTPTVFAPNTTTSRAMMVTVLYRLAGSPDVSGLKNPFTDVAADAWYADAVLWASSTGVTLGRSETTFVPAANVTRAEMAAFLMRYAELKGADTTQRAELKGFTDAASIPDWASDAMQWAFAEGILQGMTKTTLEPQGSATRAQLATVLERYLSK